MTEKETYILLNMVEGLGPKTIQSLKEHFPRIQDVLGCSSKILQEKLRIKSSIVQNLLKASQTIDLKKELDFIQQEKIEVVSLSDASYPTLLREIYDAPPILYVKGNTNFTQSIAMVGARSSTHYGNETAYKLAFQLVSCGLSVVSGLARGIDLHAHRGALAGHGKTVGVMGCGFRYFYPEEHRSLADEMIKGGGSLLSEFPSDTPPIGINFPRRNRIISGLSMGVVVVEAAQRSGSLITADFALEQGRSVFAVPGRIDSPSASGTLHLIKDGAKLVQSVEDIIEELGIEQEALVTISKSLGQGLGPDESKVLQAIGNDPMNVDQVRHSVQLETSKVLALLFQLELKKQVKQLPGKYYVKTGGRV